MAPVAEVAVVNYHEFQEHDYPQLLEEFEGSKPGRQLHAAAADGSESVGYSGPQGKVKPLTIIDDPADWSAKNIKPEDYTVWLTETDVAELIASTDAILARGVKDEDDIKQLTRAAVDLPTLGPKLVGWADREVTHGRGFLLIKGFPVEHYKDNRPGTIVAFWSLALLLGRVQISQTDRASDGSTFGSILNHITPGRWANAFHDPESHLVNGRQDTVRLNFHSDQGATDLIGILCLSAAEQGGESLVVSGVAVWNELLRRGRKDLAEVLSSPGLWYTARQKDQSAHPSTDGTGQDYADHEETIPFEFHDGPDGRSFLSVHYNAHKFTNTVKQLTPLQEEAIWAVTAIAEAPEFKLQIKLEPGDLELLHNPTVWHARTAVVDGNNRHLIRWWVSSDRNDRPPAPHFVPRSNVGPRGGFAVPHYDDLSKQRLPLYPYSRHDGLGQSHVP